MALRVSTVKAAPIRYIPDWRLLHGWRSPLIEVPTEGQAGKWEYSPWEVYRRRILWLSALLLLQSLLIILLLANIAKRKRALQTLRRKQEDLTEAQQLARVGAWQWNVKNGSFTWSEEVYRIHGLDPGLPPPSYEEFAKLFTPESWSRSSNALEEAKQTGVLREIDLELVHADDGSRWVTVQGTGVRDANAMVTCLRGTVQDITDRKRAERSLQESEKRFRLIANTAPVMIWTSGPDKLCDYFNQPWLELTGRPLAAELGNGWAEGVHFEDRTACLNTYTEAFDARQAFEMQYRFRRHDGQYRWILDTAVPRFNEDGSFAGYIGYCLDITDRKDAEEILSTVSRRLIEAQEIERSRIARDLHDDINQRLALLANRIQECEQTASANKDPLQSKKLWDIWHLTNEIATDIQHMSHQLHPSKLQYLGLAAAVRDLCHEFSKKHKFDIECVVADLPRYVDQNISLSLFRTVQESLSNVVKHSHARHVRIELTCQSNTILLSISDDGGGFNPEDARNKNGLGLISMRERLRSVGGDLSILSKPSGGTQVRGSVPVPDESLREGGESAAD